jgi:dipeptidase D
MVCVARPGKRHDFAKDAIALVRDGEQLRADGTTLGADNGIAVATMLAIAADRSLEHGPLELLFTIDEETGLTGAQGLGQRLLKSRTLINLDTEEEGSLCVGCAGGRDTMGTWALACEPVRAGSAAIEVRVTGLQGGHSGVEIHAGRGNAIKLLNRVLLDLLPLDARIARCEGGSKRNAIPAEAVAVVCLPKAKLDEARARVAEMRGVLRDELATVEPELDVVAGPAKSRPARVYTRAFQRRIMRVLSALPHGVVKMNAEIAGLVETSTNVAVLRQTPRALSLATSQRSMVASEIHEIIDGVTAVLELGGAEVTGTDGYPGWKPDLGSRVLAAAVSEHRELYGAEPRVGAIHAGLECGIIGEKYPGMDMVSLGPTIRGAHSPDERVHIPSVERYWAYLLAILRRLG